MRQIRQLTPSFVIVLIFQQLHAPGRLSFIQVRIFAVGSCRVRIVLLADYNPLTFNHSAGTSALLFGLKIGFRRILDSLSSAHCVHDFTDFRQQNFTKFEPSTSVGVAMNPFRTKFWKFSRDCSFYKKKLNISNLFQYLTTAGHHNSAMIIDRRKFITKWFLYGMSGFYFYRWNQFKVIPRACTLRTRSPSRFLCCGVRVEGIRHITLTQAEMIDYWVTWHVRHDGT